MYCPRIKHYARLNSSGKIGCCGHMVNAQQFPTYEEMINSDWIKHLQSQMKKQEWPKECIRCEQTEKLNNTSIRLNSIERDKILSKFDKDYIQLGGTLDNYCNSACITCNPNLSTRIGNLKKTLVVKDNYKLYQTLPLEHIVELDINGGEPSISDNYNNLLDNLPVNVKIIRINTNANVKIKQLKSLLDKGITVIITVSFDGINKVHEYIRYPIKWKTFENNLMYYKDTSQEYKNMKLDTWTTVSCLNIGELSQIQTYCKTHNIRHEFAFLNTPKPLNVKYKNWFTKDINLQGVAVEQDNTKELIAFLALEEAARPGIERFWI
jgi:hypothetical protein